MKSNMKLTIAGAALSVIAGCTTSDKAATPADTATGQATAIAPAGASVPVVSAPGDSTKTATVAQPSRPKSTPVTTPKTATESPMRDSAFRPKATVDENGNIQPIKRDSLR